MGGKETNERKRLRNSKRERERERGRGIITNFRRESRKIKQPVVN